MKRVSFVAAATVAVMLTLAGCPGTMPEDSTDTAETPPTMQVFEGTLIADLEMITVTITRYTSDDVVFEGPALDKALEGFGGVDQKFSYVLSEELTMITVTGELVAGLGFPTGVPATRSMPGSDLNGTWGAEVTDPKTRATTTLTLEITAPNFTLTVAVTPASS